MVLSIFFLSVSVKLTDLAIKQPNYSIFAPINTSLAFICRLFDVKKKKTKKQALGKTTAKIFGSSFIEGIRSRARPYLKANNISVTSVCLKTSLSCMEFIFSLVRIDI